MLRRESTEPSADGGWLPQQRSLASINDPNQRNAGVLVSTNPVWNVSGSLVVQCCMVFVKCHHWLRLLFGFLLNFCFYQKQPVQKKTRHLWKLSTILTYDQYPGYCIFTSLQVKPMLPGPHKPNSLICPVQNPTTCPQRLLSHRP